MNLQITGLEGRDNEDSVSLGGRFGGRVRVVRSSAGGSGAAGLGATINHERERRAAQQ